MMKPSYSPKWLGLFHGNEILKKVGKECFDVKLEWLIKIKLL